VHVQPWPMFDRSKIIDQDVTIAIQVNGKLRDTIPVAVGMALIQKDIETEAKNRENIKKYLAGKAVKKTIFVPGKLINFVI
jgi:leucyl-tRNA synthetase